MKRKIRSGKDKNFTVGSMILLILSLLYMELPYSDYSIIQVLIPAIGHGGARTYPSGFLFLILILVACYFMIKSKEDKSTFTVIVLLMIGISILFQSVTYLKKPVYYFSQGARAIEVEDTQINIKNQKGIISLELTADLKFYSNYNKGVSIIVVLPDSIKDMFEESSLTVEHLNNIYRNQERHISYCETIQLKDDFNYEDLMNTYYFYDDYKLIIKDGEREVVIRRNDSL